MSFQLSLQRDAYFLLLNGEPILAKQKLAEIPNAQLDVQDLLLKGRACRDEGNNYAAYILYKRAEPILGTDLIAPLIHQIALELFSKRTRIQDLNDLRVLTKVYRARDLFRDAPFNPEAEVRLGACYLYGYGVKKNKERGIELLIEAAENGNTFALDCLEKKARVGDTQAQAVLRAYYSTHQNLDTLVQAAQNGNARARGYLEKETEFGNIEAQARLGFCYLHGFGGRKNRYHALDLLTLAAQDGSAFAMDCLEVVFNSRL